MARWGAGRIDRVAGPRVLVLIRKRFCPERQVADHLLVHDVAPYLTPGGLLPAGAAPRRRDESWCDLLDKADWPLFNRLREWRGERSRAEGISPYVICNNRQLTELVRRRPAKPTRRMC